METILVIVLTIFAIAALVVWWALDIDIADIVAMVGAPATGLGIIYWYGTATAWAGAIVLFLVGGFALYYWVNRRQRPRL